MYVRPDTCQYPCAIPVLKTAAEIRFMAHDYRDYSLSRAYRSYHGNLEGLDSIVRSANVEYGEVADGEAGKAVPLGKDI